MPAQQFSIYTQICNPADTNGAKVALENFELQAKVGGIIKFTHVQNFSILCILGCLLYFFQYYNDILG